MFDWSGHYEGDLHLQTLELVRCEAAVCPDDLNTLLHACHKFDAPDHNPCEFGRMQITSQPD